MSMQKDPASYEQAQALGLNEDEWGVILKRLGRAPNQTELGIFSVMWSEHCSYKSSRRHLRKLPTTGACVICGPGENAGVIDIGDGLACIFKMESHNHPSYIEPYQGAATGVGGIMRDVFTMGARPVALLNALRFGSPDHPKTRALVSGVVAGIGGYGNCVGVPTVGGETNFHAGYDGNILVNAMCLGIAEQDSIFYSAAKGAGNPVLYVGAKTGRDGIHGATMASAEFDDETEAKRPTVQVGDPFTEKRLIEACLELMQTNCIVAIQDMGAAGLTSSSIEMADKGGVGIDLDLDKVPQRETHMTPVEMMLSESQERMLIVLRPGKESEAQEIFERWELDVALIGKTTDTGHMVLHHKGETVCDIPIAPLGDDAPNYDRPWVAPPTLPVINASEIAPGDPAKALLRLVQSPDMASKRWIWEQYDRHVMADTLKASGGASDAAVVRVHDTNKALAMSSDCTPRYVLANPFEGGKQAVAECWRNLIASGASPMAVTDCLNFGNPERPDIMGQFVRAIDGMAEACRALDFPVVSGNVSLYNETAGTAIPPTPVIGGVGLIDDATMAMGFGGAVAGDALILLGKTTGWLGASLNLREIEGREEGAPPPIDLEQERRTGMLVRTLIHGGQVHAVHDLSDGGLACAATDMALASRCGVHLMASDTLSDAAWFFGEDQGRYLIAVKTGAVDALLDQAQQAGVDAKVVGTMEGLDVVLGDAMPLALDLLSQKHENWLPAYMEDA
ncbi:MAG: phosphoribosylformylglycinamidine synthase subunit PurL [Robiginitomaculum sp.]|nr:phosphoribosylformylglycinamidine synthase subunit PurL [Robiginitomaculum sp.]